MRKMLIFRGAPGSGKTNLINKLGLTYNSLSQDQIRSVISGVTMSPSGAIGVAQDFNSQVYSQFIKTLQDRMSRGETIAVESINETIAELSKFFELADIYKYDVRIMDFSNIPLETILKNNENRNPFTIVPKNRVISSYNTLQENNLLDFFKTKTKDEIEKIFFDTTKYNSSIIIEWNNDDSHLKYLKEWLSIHINDFNNYKSIVHIGDLQGCLTVLIDENGPLHNGLEDDTHYVFVGDLCDRGIENGKLLKWFKENCSNRPNVTLIRGNHELHLERFAYGKPDVSSEFSNFTKPQILESDLTKDDIREIVEFSKEFLFYKKDNIRVMVTHGGLPSIPTDPVLISSEQYLTGPGYYEDPVDVKFSANTPEHWFQVHGHRNSSSLPIEASPRSFNLEGGVEFGGSLRLVTLDNFGWHPSSYPNKVFKKEKISKNSIKSKSTSPDWMSNADRLPIKLSDSTINNLRSHKGVNERQASTTLPHVVSFSFTKNVFYDRTWDDIVVKARGLFINKNTNEIIARSYDKFFNEGEREETSIENLVGTLKFPVRAYLKENGFLGIVGYDSHLNELFLSSKTFAEGEFADMFRMHFNNFVKPEIQERLKIWLRENEASMVFEVIDPIRDPHIIRYDKPHLVLLDIFHRSESGEKASYEKLKSISNKFGFTPKTLVATLQSPESLLGFRKKTRSVDYTYNGSPVEGFVIEDQNGFLYKEKGDYYSFWKGLRGQVGRIVSCRMKNKEFQPQNLDNSANPELAKNFLLWAETLETDVLRQISIIELSDKYNEYVNSLETPSYP